MSVLDVVDLLTPREVKRLLTHLYDPVYLQCHPLIQLLPLNPQQTRAQAAQSFLVEALESLKPPGQPDESDPAWRPYLILFYRYVERRSAPEIRRRLAICDRWLRHEQQKAFAAMATILRDMLPPSE